MALFFEISIGTDAGKRFKLLPGLRLGRTHGEVLIDDPKASGLHAIIEQDPDGTYFVRDLDSTNGTKINDLKISRAQLLVGTRVQIGRTYLSVVDDNAAPILQKTSDSPPAPKVLKELTWEGKINSHLSTLPLQNLTRSQKLAPFRQAIELHFIEGIQSQDLITLSYGPRKAGSTSFDIRLLDPEAPEVAFQIEPNESGDPVIFTASNGAVLINERPLPSAELNSGDTIKVGKTLIRVGFI